MLPLPPEMHHSMTLDQHDALRRQVADERLAKAAAAQSSKTTIPTTDRAPSFRTRLSTAALFGWLRARSL
jgi:hypothetical protein